MPRPRPGMQPEAWVRALAFEVPQANVIDFFEPWRAWANNLALATGNVFDVPHPKPTQGFWDWVSEFYASNA
jgi:hypothetical protein